MCDNEPAKDIRLSTCAIPLLVEEELFFCTFQLPVDSPNLILESRERARGFFYVYSPIIPPSNPAPGEQNARRLDTVIHHYRGVGLVPACDGSDVPSRGKRVPREYISTLPSREESRRRYRRPCGDHRAGHVCLRDAAVEAVQDR